VEYELGSGGTEDMEAVQTFPFVPLFASLLFSSLLFIYSYWISAQYKWRRHGFLPPANGGGVSPCAGSAERLPLSYTDRLWDLWVRTIAYVERLFDYSLSFPFIAFSCTGFGSPGGLCVKSGIM
jgi:hypothetical protein